MKNVIFLILIGLTLSGCMFRPHKLDIRQGNVINEDAAARLQVGMSEEQVKSIMGNPVMINIFSGNRLDYIYTNQPGYEPMAVKRVICTFRGGRLENIQRTKSTVRQ